MMAWISQTQHCPRGFEISFIWRPKTLNNLNYFLMLVYKNQQDADGLYLGLIRSWILRKNINVFSKFGIYLNWLKACCVQWHKCYWFWIVVVIICYVEVYFNWIESEAIYIFLFSWDIKYSKMRSGLTFDFPYDSLFPILRSSGCLLHFYIFLYKLNWTWLTNWRPI